MNNIRESEFNKNVIQVYTQESGFTGYKGFDFNKIDDIEEILKSGIDVSVKNVEGINVYVTGVSNLPAVTLADNQNVGVTGSVAVTGPLTDSELRLNPVPVSGTVTAKTEKSSTISNSTPASSNGTVLSENANRKELYVQNLATGVLYVKYGDSASSNSFNFVLAANTETNAGDGGSLSDQSYTGIVSVSGAILNYISWQRS